MNDIQSKLQKITSLSLTGTSPYFVNDTTEHDLTNTDSKGGAYALMVLTDTVLDMTYTVTNVQGNSLTGVTIPAGVYFIAFSKIKLVSGAVILHRNNLQ